MIENEKGRFAKMNMGPVEDESTPFRLTGAFLIGSNNPGSMKGLLESPGHRFVGNRRVKGLVPKLGARIGRLRQYKMLRPHCKPSGSVRHSFNNWVSRSDFQLPADAIVPLDFKERK
ncbi:Speckle-type POZ [Fusarium agapanthi]|uniref:Speckle-type POZ n=1 Tax=Fusarium agapanthi TaxID=1803897 RepID=A0A9P5B5D4_9HYPO|nr:Speckle-type POZ [Fusarium agapanthi]